MNSFFKTGFTLLLFGFSLSCLGARDIFPLPPESAIPGWTPSGPGKHHTPGNLFDYINGGAEIFNEFGFRELLVQSYRKGDSEITVELYRMDGAPAALGMFYQQGGQNQGAPTDPEHIARSPYQWTLQKGPWYIQLNAPANARGLEGDMAAFTEAVLGQITAEPVLLFDVLPEGDRIGGSEFLVRGQYGMQPVFTFGEGDILQLEGRHFAIGAEYRDQQGRKITRMVIPYGDPLLARRILEGLNGHLDPYLKIHTHQDDTLVFVDYKQAYGFIRRVGKQLEIGLHLLEPPSW
jgi:hypothetical protein